MPKINISRKELVALVKVTSHLATDEPRLISVLSKLRGEENVPNKKSKPKLRPFLNLFKPYISKDDLFEMVLDFSEKRKREFLRAVAERILADVPPPPPKDW